MADGVLRANECIDARIHEGNVNWTLRKLMITSIGIL